MKEHGKLKKSTVIIAILLALILISSYFLIDGFIDKKKDADLSTYHKVVEVDGKQYEKKDGIETLLIIGTDKFKDETEADFFKNNEQADFLMLMVIDKNSGKCYGVHINRDTMADVRVLGVGGKVIKTEQMQIALSHAYGSGSNDSCLNTLRSVSSLLDGITIDHYIAVTMDAVSFVNDYVGGVEVEILDDFSDVDATMVKGKTMTLHGEQALTYVRSRMNIDNKTNVKRMERQRQYLNGLLEKIKAKSKDEDFGKQLLDGIGDAMTTDYSVSGLQNLVGSLDGYTFDSIKTISGELIEGQEYMEFYPDSNAVSSLVLELFYAEK